MSLFRRDDCVACDGSTPTCNCAKGEQCILTSRTCSQCPTIQCIKGSSSSSGGGVNPGVIAGPVVAVLAVASLGLFWWLRKKKRRDLARLEELSAHARKAESAGFHLSQPNSPQPPSARSASGRSQSASHLPAPSNSINTRRSGSRSPVPPAPVNAEYYDQNGATTRVYQGNTISNFDPRHPDNGGTADPFSDRQSVSTTGSQSTNIIPIQYIPPSKSGDTLDHTLQSPQGGSLSQAARTLDEARQNLFRPRQTPPARPARSPDLHLRLSPPNARDLASDLRSPPGQLRDSMVSENSSTPSFLSGSSYDIHTDAPKIVTSKQVQIGRLHQAEVVQFGQNQAGFVQSRQQPTHLGGDEQVKGAYGALLTSADLSNTTSAQIVKGLPNVRTLTPTSSTFQQDDTEEGLVSEEPTAITPTDLRFSMGSLAYDRNSVSTMGTANYFARPDAMSMAIVSRSPRAHGQQYEVRESMLSTKTDATGDSFLSGLQILPPHNIGPSSSQISPLPQSTSVSTLDHHATVTRPPAAFKPLTSLRPGTLGSGTGTGMGTTPSRPTTATSTTDSFLDTSRDSMLAVYPFVPPNIQGEAELPSAGLPNTAVSRGQLADRTRWG